MASHGGEIREGFLCPMCMKDLGTVTQLQSHFEEAHSNEDKVVLNQLRGLFDKAKKKFLGEKDSGEYSGDSGKSLSPPTSQSSSLYDVDYWQPQETGQTRSWTDSFRGIRDARVDKYVVETNKLLIRLDKLISPDAPTPTESNKRKAFEKTVVMWMADGEVKGCRFCGRSFSMTRRRHHCRLCGGIMCDRCSHFLTHAYARSAAEKLTNPAFNFKGGRDTGFLKRAGSNSSLNSMFSTEGDPHIRSCDECRQLLERRDQQMEQRNTKSTIVLMYDKMKCCIHDCEKLLDTYLPMVESLSLGESTHNMQSAVRLRAELLKQYEVIDKISKRITLLGTDSEEGLSPKQTLLQKSIRIYATNFMQENMMGLQNLPSEEQYAKLQQKRTAQIQQQIALERQATLQAQEQERKQQDKQQQQQSSSSVMKEEEKWERSSAQKHTRNNSKGWKPAENVMKPSNSDPMLQQIEIIRSYIKQAKEAQKWDEVNMLEQNLKDLQREYSSQQTQTWS